MVTAIRSLAAVVLFIGAAVALAVPATADRPIEGSYSSSEVGLPSATWTALQCNQFGVCR